MSCRCLGRIFAALAVAFFAVPAAAEQPGFSQIQVHNPYSSHYNSLTPIGGRNFSFGASYGGYSPGFFASGLYSYPPYGIYPPPWVPFYRPMIYGGIYPPFWGLPGNQFGPQAVQRFIGGDNLPPPAAPAAAPAAAAPQAGAGFGVLAPNVAAAKGDNKRPRATNADARARSQRFIVLGDTHFNKQAYSDAYQRYKLAAQAAPDMGDGLLRQGFALVALGRYDSAARSFKRGLAMDPNWANSDFRLDTLYNDNGLAKAAHIKALVQEAARAPSSDILFLLGLMLYFDGQPEQARPLFVRSRKLAGGNSAHLDGFLRKLAPENVAPAPADAVRRAADGGRRGSRGAAC